MKILRKLYDQLNGVESFEQKYPQYNMNDKKVHVLYMAPCLNGTGYYRMIVPMLKYNQSATHSAIVSSIHKWNFTKEFDDYDNPVDRRLIEWADRIILPTIFTNISYIQESFKTINPEIKIGMDMDCYYHAIPPDHPCHTKFTKEKKAMLLKNLASMDFVLTATQGLKRVYSQLLNKTYPNTKVDFIHQPSFIVPTDFEGFKKQEKIKNEKFRIGWIGTLTNHQDLLTIKEVLVQIINKYPNQLELVLFGWNGKLPDGTEPLKGLPYKIVKSVSFLDYYEKLHQLNLDLVLLPMRDIPFNTKGKSDVKLQEITALGIPVIVSDLSPYNKLKGENGVLTKDLNCWIEKIESIIGRTTFSTD